MKISYSIFREKLKGCYIGKAVGGTLGMPFEGNLSLRDLTFYDPVPTEMMANDDIDLQVIALEVIKRSGLPINRKKLAEGYKQHLLGVPDEYGVMHRNLDLSLHPPLSGSFDNKFSAGMGGAIRSEIWACLAPGNPDLAVRLAIEDACIDHCDDGIEAVCFIAAVESAAFVENDSEKLINIGLSYLNPDKRLYKALTFTKKTFEETNDYIKTRELLLEKFYVQNWTDVSINLSFILLGLLYGKGDLGKSICTTVNCGWDTDCTGATLGAILGIMNPSGIDEKWTAPIGDALVLSSCIVGMHSSSTIEGFCDEIAALESNVAEYYNNHVIANRPYISNKNYNISSPFIYKKENVWLDLHYNKNESLLMLNPFIVKLIYPEEVAIMPSKCGKFMLDIKSIDDNEYDLKIELKIPDGFIISQSKFEGKTPLSFEFEITAPDEKSYKRYKNMLDIRLSANQLLFETTAGILTGWMWEREIDGEKEIISVPNHYFMVPVGKSIYRAQFKYGMININGKVLQKGPPYGYNPTVLAQSDGCPLKVFINNSLVLEHEGSEYTPAFHRSTNTSDTFIHWNWNDLEIVVENENDSERELFFGLSKPTSEWISELEWRLPV